jgi:hypothetical protein
MAEDKTSLLDSGESMVSTASGTVSGWLTELLGPLQGNPIAYSAVVGSSLLVLLWLVHLFIRFVLSRSLLKLQE